LVTVARQLGACQADLEVIRADGPDAPERLWTLLDGSDRRWLLVFDNADDPSVLAGQPPAAPERVPGEGVRLPGDGTGWLRSSRRGLAVVTTRDKDPATWGRGAQILPVEPLADEDAARVLLDRAPQAGGEAEARLLARRLGGLPLALRLAGSGLGSDVVHRRSFGEYLRALDTPGDRPRLLTAKPSIGRPAGDRSVVVRTWEMSLDDLAERGIAQARPLLRLLSCFAAATPIPRGMLSCPPLDRLLAAQRGASSTASRAIAEYDLEDGLHGLSMLSLLDVRPFGGTAADERAVVVHPVIAAANLTHLAEAKGSHAAASIWAAAVQVLSAALRGLDEERAEDWPDYLVLGPHLHALFATAAAHVDHQHLSDLIALAVDAASAHVLSGAALAGERLSAAAASMAPYLGGADDDAVILRARHEVAWSVGMQGRYAEAEPMFRHALAGLKETLGGNHRYTLNTHNELAWIAGCQQRWDEAEAIYRTVLISRAQTLGDRHPDTMITRHELGWVLGNQGRSHEAASILQKVLLDREQVLGADHARTIMTRHELAWNTACLGHLSHAESAYRDVVQSRRAVLGRNHPETLTAEHELAWVLASAGKTRAARAQYKAVLATRTQVLGATHPDTAKTRDALTSLRNGTIVTPRHIP
jgi:tetratricopeptide (TPR) repeat protein